MAEIDKRGAGLLVPDGYFFYRDFEFVQPLYDVAFLLSSGAFSSTGGAPKYRVISLNRAAHSLDGYSTVIARWLKGDLTEDQLDYVPSARIGDLLARIGETGTTDGLREILSPQAEGVLRLRSLRGFGAAQAKEFLVGGTGPSGEVLRRTARRCGMAEAEILAVFEGAGHGVWQAAHVVPPLMRFLNSFERRMGEKPKWRITGISDGISPVRSCFKVHVLSKCTKFDSGMCRKVTDDDPFFVLRSYTPASLSVRHQMGWHFDISLEPDSSEGKYLEEYIWDLDPVAHDIPTYIRSDLHTHSFWSDGVSTPLGLAEAANQSGLEYIAITEHSRSSKLQGGLTPSSWLRQAMSVSDLRKSGRVLHGLEVDILHDGQLDMPEGILAGADLVIASVHSKWSASVVENTTRILKAIESAHVDVIGHPTSAMMGRPGQPSYVRPPANVDWESVFEWCLRWNVALEINCFPSRLDLSPELLGKAINAGCWISLGSDAHSRFHLELLKFGIAIAENAKAAHILNSLSFREFQERRTELRQFRTKLERTHRHPLQTKLFKSPLVTFGEKRPSLARLNGKPRVPEGSIVIGLDLTEGKSKKTGVARLCGTDVETISLRTDEEIVEYIKDNKPAIVSIDSPLGLPGGGASIDPKAGIVRLAERHLSSVGIPSYPALIESMAGLTLRGMRLRVLIEALAEAPLVIESYPGAAQDLLCIPRKQRGLNLLRAGLKELGLTGSGLNTTSHDEMDAITAAAVGRYFEVGQYEAMGIPSEAQLIVPRTSILTFERPPLICLGGKTGVGKSVVARYLALFYGFEWIKTRNVIRDLLLGDFDKLATRRLNLETTQPFSEDHLSEFGGIILEEYNQDPLRARLTQIIMGNSNAAVIDSLRSVSDVDVSMLSDRAVYLWYIDCTDTAIHERLGKREDGKATDRTHYLRVDKNADAVKRSADLCLSNDGTLEYLHRSVDDALFLRVARVEA